MLDSIFVGMSGLLAASKGLGNVSQNVANLNTAGYKRFELGYEDVGYRTEAGSPQAATGDGVAAGDPMQVFQQGELRQTGNDLDAAVEGAGFFVFRRGADVLLSRSGQFAFDAEGLLTAREDGARVAGLVSGRLVDISLDGRRTLAPQPTHRVVLEDTLSVNDTGHTLNNLTVIDSLGRSHALTLRLTNNAATTPGQWTYTLLDGDVTLTTAAVEYSGDGAPVPGSSTHVFSYAPSGAAAMEVTLDFSKTRQLSSSASSLRMASQDGKPSGYLTRTSFDAQGHLVLSYSNGETVKAEQLALALVNDVRRLRADGGNRFGLHSGAELRFGTADGFFGTVRGGQLEASNVDLAQEFGELVVTQRSYQASSQVISAASEMIQQLNELRGRR